MRRRLWKRAFMRSVGAPRAHPEILALCDCDFVGGKVGSSLEVRRVDRHRRFLEIGDYRNRRSEKMSYLKCSKWKYVGLPVE